MLQNIRQSTVLIWTLFGILCFQILLAFQGFDLADEGFSLVFFQQIFNCPQSVERNFLFWFSGIVGSVWLKLFPEAGIFSFRILGILMHILGLVLLILIFRKRLPDWILALSCVVITLIPSFGVIVFSHNDLVVVLSLTAFYFLIKGIEKNLWWALVLSGFFLVLTGFSRLPSFTLGIWILLILLFSNDWKQRLKQIGFACVGAISGVLAVFLTMFFLGHIDVFLDSVRIMFSTARLPENSHSFGQLTWTIAYNYRTNCKALPDVNRGFWCSVFSVTFFKKSTMDKPSVLCDFFHRPCVCNA